MEKKFGAMAAGHLCLDIIPKFYDSSATTMDQIMRPGKLINVGESVLSTGGAVSNTGITMEKLGIRLCFCACVGDDEIGAMTIDIAQRSGSSAGIRRINGSASSYSIVIAPPGIDRIFLHNPGTNDEFNADYLDPALISQCRLFHFGYPPLMKKMFENDGDGLVEVFKTAKKAGATTSCDMTLPDPASASGKADWRAILKKVLPYVDIFTPSIEEIFYMLQPQEFLETKQRHKNAELIDYLEPELFVDICEEVIDMGVKVVLLKAGCRGVFCRTAKAEYFDSMGFAKPHNSANWSNRKVWAAALKTDVFGTAAGAGDATIGGFLSAFLKGLDVEKALKVAVCCGYQTVRVFDATSGVTNWQETLVIADNPPAPIDPKLPEKKWKLLTNGIWTNDT